MVVLTISVDVPPAKRNELLSTFRLFQDLARAEDGCIECNLLWDVDHENHLELEERWSHRAQLDSHLLSANFTALLGAVKLLGESFEIRINDSTPAEGMAIVEYVRANDMTTAKTNTDS